ncbi:unnamed protein product [Didymodactylos carnosus]|uniref:Uncharacterized protein n=1 Tax=Didymodactylos carnosus TaxID=1234261 RepID=A0A814ZHD1_9BILA|nr:unnamed protein product [Didymodactylos carnosus]CAF4014225.1 unnamed protein product [Didymodactylos carnosus]
MPGFSQLIINTYLNSVKKTYKNLKDLSSEQYLALINKLCSTLDNLDDESSNTTISTDVSSDHEVSSHPLFMRILDQNDLLLKTLCSQHSQSVVIKSHDSSSSSQFQTVSTTNASPLPPFEHISSQLQTTMPLKQLPLLSSRASTKASSLNQHNLLVSPSSDSQNTQSQPASQLDAQLNSTPPSTPVFITGSSIIQNLEQGVSTFNGTNFNVKVRTKPGYSILDMIQSIQMNSR